MVKADESVRETELGICDGEELSSRTEWGRLGGLADVSLAGISPHSLQHVMVFSAPLQVPESY
jgi:hypothetical protein